MQMSYRFPSVFISLSSIQSVILQLASVNVIIIDNVKTEKSQNRGFEETQYTKYNYCKIRFLLCKFVQARKLD